MSIPDIEHNNEINNDHHSTNKNDLIKEFDGSNRASFPSEIYDYPNLTSLQLRNNYLTEVPELSKSNHLKELEVSCNQIEEIPQNLKNLNSLLINDNKITKIPTNLSTFNKLEVLELNDNLISEIPQEIGDCQTIKILKLGNNKITKVPKSFKNLKNKLELFSLWGNPLKLEDDDGNYGTISLQKIFGSKIILTKEDEDSIVEIKRVEKIENEFLKSQITAKFLFIMSIFIIVTSVIIFIVFAIIGVMQNKTISIDQDK